MNFAPVSNYYVVLPTSTNSIMLSPSVRISLIEEIGTGIRMTVIYCNCHIDRCGSTEIRSDVALMRLSQL